MESGNSMDKEESGNSMDKEESGGGGQRKSIGIRLREWLLRKSEERKQKIAAAKHMQIEKAKRDKIEDDALRDAVADGEGTQCSVFKQRLSKLLDKPNNKVEASRVTERFREEYDNISDNLNDYEALASSIPGNEESIIDELRNDTVFEFARAVDKYSENTRDLKNLWHSWNKRFPHLLSKLDNPKKNNDDSQLLTPGSLVWFAMFLITLCFEVLISYFYLSESENISNYIALMISGGIVIGSIAALILGRVCAMWFFAYNRFYISLSVIGMLVTATGLYVYADYVRQMRANADLPVQSATSREGLDIYDPKAFDKGREDANAEDDLVFDEGTPSPDKGKSLSEVLSGQWIVIILFIQFLTFGITFIRFDKYKKARKCKQKLDEVRSTFERESLALINEKNHHIGDLAYRARKIEKTIPAAIQYHQANFDRVDEKALSDANEDVQIYYDAYRKTKREYCPELPNITLEEYSIGIPKTERNFFNERVQYLEKTVLPDIKKYIDILKSLLDKISALLEEFRRQILVTINA